MVKKSTLRHRLRRFISERAYVVESHVFLRSHRGFRLLAAQHGVVEAKSLPADEEVTVMVTLGWWVTSFFRRPKTCDAVVARRTFGRFGNQTFQLANTLTLARSLEINVALLPGNTVTEPGTHLVEGVTWNNGPDIVKPVTTKNVFAVFPGLFSRRAHLVGTFFQTAVIPQELVNRELRTTTFAHLRDSLTTTQPITPEDPQHLVIHLRGDDVFNVSPPKAYAQPPLAFYQLVLSDDDWKKVTIVSGDQKNPVLVPLIEELDSRGIEHRFQSGTLNEDIAQIRRAKGVVSGRGSFIPAITGLSDAVTTVYCFEDADFFRTDIDVRVVVDRLGEYVAKTYRNNWRNTDEQRSLMLSYSVSSLEFKSAEGAH